MGGHYLQMPQKVCRYQVKNLRWLVISYYHFRIFNLDLFFPNN